MVVSGNRLQKALRIFSGMFDDIFVLFLQFLLTHMLLAIIIRLTVQTGSLCQAVVSRTPWLRTNN